MSRATQGFVTNFEVKKAKPCISLWYNTPAIWEHSRTVENTCTRLQLVFSIFFSCSQMLVVFYHSVIHGLGFFIC